MTPLMDVMSALLLAFILGIGMASIGSKTMLPVFDELNVFIEKVISVCYYSTITIPYFRDFPKYDLYGRSGKSIICICNGVRYDYCTAFHYANIQYTVAGTLSKTQSVILNENDGTCIFDSTWDTIICCNNSGNVTTST